MEVSKYVEVEVMNIIDDIPLRVKVSKYALGAAADSAIVLHGVETVVKGTVMITEVSRYAEVDDIAIIDDIPSDVEVSPYSSTTPEASTVALDDIEVVVEGTSLLIDVSKYADVAVGEIFGVTSLKIEVSRYADAADDCGIIVLDSIEVVLIDTVLIVEVSRYAVTGGNSDIGGVLEVGIADTTLEASSLVVEPEAVGIIVVAVKSRWAVSTILEGPRIVVMVGREALPVTAIINPLAIINGEGDIPKPAASLARTVLSS